MLNVEKVFNLFLAHGVDFFTGVPDSLLNLKSATALIR